MPKDTFLREANRPEARDEAIEQSKDTFERLIDEGGDASRSIGNIAQIQQRRQQGVLDLGLPRHGLDTLTYIQGMPNMSQEEIAKVGEDTVFFDSATREYGIGWMDPEVAAYEVMSQDFSRGTFGENIEFDKFIAHTILGTSRQGWRKNTKFFSLSDENRKMLEHFATFRGNNITKLGSGSGYSNPFTNFFYSNPADLLGTEAPEGFTVEAALQELSEVNPELFKIMATATNSLEAVPLPDGTVAHVPTVELLAQIAEGARNGLEVMQKINTVIQLTSIGRSLEHFEKNAPATRKFWHYTKNFVYNGLINDPDLIAELIFSGVLAVGSAGLAGAGGLVAMTTKINWVRKVMKKSRWVKYGTFKTARGLNKASRFVRGGGRWAIPENIPSSILSAGRIGGWMRKTTGLNRFLIGRASDVVEGTVSGGIAEWFNQNRKVGYGLQDEINWHAIRTEALVEGAISWVLNPIIGGAMKMVVYTPTAVVNWGFTKSGNEQLAKEFGESFKKAAGFFNPDAGRDFILLQQGLLRLEERTGRVTGMGDPNKINWETTPDLVVMMETIYQESGMSSSEHVDYIDSIVSDVEEQMAKDGEGSLDNMPTDELTQLVADRILSDLESSEMFAGRKGEIIGNRIRKTIEMRQQLYYKYKNAQKSGESYKDKPVKDMTYNEYIDAVVSDNNYFDLLDDPTKALTKDRMGESFDSATPQQRLETAVQIQNEQDVNRHKFGQKTMGEQMDIMARLEILHGELNQKLELEQKAAEAEGKPIETDDRGLREFEEPDTKPAEVDAEPAEVDAEPKEGSDALFGTTTKGASRPILEVIVDSTEMKNEKLDEIAKGDMTPEEKAKAEATITKIDMEIAALKKTLVAMEELSGLDGKALDLKDASLEDIYRVIELQKAKEAAHKEDMAAHNKNFSLENEDSIRMVLTSLVGSLFPIKTDGTYASLDFSRLSPEDIKFLKKLKDSGLIKGKRNLKLLDKLINKKEGVLGISRAKGEKLIHELNRAAEKLETKLDNSPENKALKEALDKAYESEGAFKTERLSQIMNINRAKRKRGEYMFLTAKTWQTVMEFQKGRTAKLTANKTSWEGQVSRRKEQGVQTLMAEGMTRAEAETAIADPQFLNNYTGAFNGIVFTQKELEYMLPAGTKDQNVVSIQQDLDNALEATSRERFVRDSDADTKKKILERVREIQKDNPKLSKDVILAQVKEEMFKPADRKTYTLEEAETMYSNAYAQRTEEIGDLTIDGQLLVDGERAVYTNETFLHNVPVGTVIRVDNSPDEIATEKYVTSEAPGVTQEQADILEARAWVEFGVNLQVIAGSTQVQTDGPGSHTTIEAMRMYSALPDRFKHDTPHGRGLKMHVVFANAIANHKGHMSEAVLEAKGHYLTYRVEDVLRIVDEEIAAAQSRLTQVKEQKLSLVEHLTKMAEHEDHSLELAQTIAHLEEIDAADKIVGAELFGKHGYIAEYDVETGHPIKFLKDTPESAAVFRGVYRSHATERLAEVYKGMHPVTRSAILRQLDFEMHSNFDPNYGGTTDAPWTDADFLTYEIEFLTNLVLNPHRLIRGVTIESLGNGKQGWHSPERAAEGMVDLVLFKDLRSTDARHATTKNSGSIGEMGQVKGGPSLGISRPGRATTHGASPEGPKHATKVILEGTSEARVEQIVRLDLSKLTAKERAKLEAFAFEGWSPGDIGINLGVHRRPQLIPMPVHGSMHEKPLTKQDLKDFLTDFLYDTPNHATSLIMDQKIVADGSHLRYRKMIDDHFDYLTTGTAIMVPYPAVLQTMALELSSPLWKGLGEKAILRSVDEDMRQKIEYEKEHGKGSWTEEVAGRELFSTRNEADNSVSIMNEFDNLSKLFDPEAKKIIGEIVHGHEGEDGEWVPGVKDKLFKKNPEAYYVGGGQFTVKHIRDVIKNTRDKGMREALEPIEKILSIFDEITDLYEADAITKNWGPDKMALFDSARNIMKTLLRNEHYTAGKNSFNQEFINEGEGFEAIEAANVAYSALHGVDSVIEVRGPDYKKHMEVLRGFLMNNDEIITGRIISAAAKLDNKKKQKVLSYLSIPSSKESTLAVWKDIIGTRAARQGMTEAEVNASIRGKLSQGKTLLNILDAIIEKKAVQKHGVLTTENLAEEVRLFRPRMDKARALIDGEPNGDFSPGTDLWKELQEILHGGKMSWDAVPVFSALNTLGASAHGFDMDHWKMVDEGEGVADHDPADLGGLEAEGVLQFMSTRLSEESDRGYVQYNTHLGTTTGAKKGRVGVGTPEYKAFIQGRREEVLRETGSLTAWNKVEIHGEWLMKFKDAHEATGVFTLENTPYFDMPRNREAAVAKAKKEGLKEVPLDFEQHIDNLILKQALIVLANQEAPPIPGQTEGVDRVVHYADQLRRWAKNDESRHPKLKEELALERRLVETAGQEGGSWARRVLVERAKGGKLYSEQAGELLGKAIIKINPIEGKPKFHEKSGRVILETKQQFSPKPKSFLTPYHSRGISVIQLAHMRRQQQSQQSDIHKAAGFDEHVPPQDPTKFGGVGPWNNSSLPRPMPMLKEDLGGLELANPKAAIRAGQLYNEIRIYAAEAGYSLELDNNPELYPYFYVMMNQEKVRDKHLRRVNNKIKNGEDVNWDEEQNTLRFELDRVGWLSRDIREKKGPTTHFEDKEMPAMVLDPNIGLDEWRTIILKGLFDRNLLNQDAIKAGSFPAEGFMWDWKDSKGNSMLNPGEGLGDIKDLQLTITSKIAQSADFPKLLLDSHLARYRTKAVMELFKGDGRLARLIKEPNSMHFILNPQEKLDLYNKTMELQHEAQGDDLIFDLTLVEATHESPGKTVEALDNGMMDIQVSYDYEGKSHRFVLRSAVKSFATTLVGAPTKRHGANITLAISQESALKMFALNSNQRFVEAVDWTNITGKPMGGRKNEDTGDYEADNPMTQIIDNVTGFEQRKAHREAIVDSEALDLLSEGRVGDARKLNDRSRTQEGAVTRVIDLWGYQSNPPHSTLPFGSTFNEMHYRSLNKHLNLIESKGLVDGTSRVMISEIRNDMQYAREHMGQAHVKTVALAMTLELRNSKRQDISGSTTTYTKTLTAAELKTYINRTDKGLKDLTDAEFETVLTNALVYTNDILNVFSRNSDEKISITDFGTTNMVRSGTFWKAREYAAHSGQEHAPSFAEFLKWANVTERYAAMSDADKLSSQRQFNAAIGTEVDRMYDSSELTTNLLDVPDVKELAGHGLFRSSKNEGKFRDFIDTPGVHGIIKDDLININSDISRITEMTEVDANGNETTVGLLNESEAQMLRAMFLRLYTINPMLLKGVRLNLSASVTLGKASAIGGKYVVRLGKALKGEGEGLQFKDKVSLMEVVTHEMAHIARHKFIENNRGDWADWQQLKNTPDGEALIKKLVLAFHGGEMNPQAEAEILSYINSDEEFIAGMVSYYLMADQLPYIEGLNAKDYKIISSTLPIVDKIINWVRNILWDVRSVFTNFESDHPELSQTLDDLVMRTLGRDPESNAMMINEVGNPDAEYDKAVFPHNETPKHPSSVMEDGTTGPMNDVDYRAKVEQYHEMDKDMKEWAKEKRKETGDDTINVGHHPDYGTFQELESWFTSTNSDVIDGGDFGNKLNMAGLNRFEQVTGEIHLREAGAFDEESWENPATGETITRQVLLLDKVLEPPVLGKKSSLTPEDVRAGFHFILDQIHSEHGSPMSEGLGGLMLGLSKKWQRGGNDGPGWMRSFLLTFVVGNTGASFTYGSPLIIANLLSSLLDEQVITTLGHYTNLNGALGIRDAVERTKEFESEVMVDMEYLDTMLPPATMMRKKKRTEVKKQLAMEIWKKVDDPDYEIQIPDSYKENRLGFGGKTALSRSIVKPEDIRTAQDTVDNAALTVRRYVEWMESQAQESGFVSPMGFENKSPVKLKPMIAGDLNESFIPKIRETVVEEIEHQLGQENGYIDPATLSVARGYLPRITDSTEFVLDMGDMKPGFRKFFKDQIEGRTKKDLDDMIKTLGDPTAATEVKENLLAIIQSAQLGLMKGMLVRKIKWGDIRNHMGLESAQMKRDYLEAAKAEPSNESASRLKAWGLANQLLPSGMRSGELKFTSVSQLHAATFMHLAEQGVSMKKDSWVEPSLQRLADKGLDEHFITDPTAIMKELQKGLGSDISERALLSRLFNTKGTFDQILTLAERVAQSEKPFANLDGTEINLTTGKGAQFKKSLRILREKYEFTKGIHRQDSGIHPYVDEVVKVFPDIAKIAYGTNLTAATIIVEGGLNFADQVLRPANPASALRAAVAPLYAANPTARRQMGIDLKHVTEALTQSYAPDFEHLSDMLSTNSSLWEGTKKGLRAYGNLTVLGAHVALKGITYQRAGEMRRWVGREIHTNNMENFVNMLDAAKDENGRLPAEDSRMFKDIARKAGYGRGILGDSTVANVATLGAGGNMEIPIYLMRSGLLKKNRFLMLRAMLGGTVHAPEKGTAYSSLIKDKGEPYYNINQMRKELEIKLSREPGSDVESKVPAQQEGFREQMELLQGLRHLERLYIEDIILVPNAFDMYTKNSVLGKAWEVYMRYPTVFASNFLIRRSGRVSPGKYLQTIALASALDMLYMLTLTTAASATGYDRLQDKLASQRGWTVAEYGARLPVLGRYASMVAGLGLASLDADGRMVERAMTSVGVGAALNFIDGANEGIMYAAAGQWQEAMEHLLKFSPVLGDISIRLLWYNYLRWEWQTKEKTPDSTVDPHNTTPPQHFDLMNPATTNPYGKTMPEDFDFESVDWANIPLENLEAMMSSVAGDSEEVRKRCLELIFDAETFEPKDEIEDYVYLRHILNDLGVDVEGMIAQTFPEGPAANQRPWGSQIAQAPEEAAEATQEPAPVDIQGGVQGVTTPIDKMVASSKGPSNTSAGLADLLG